MDRKHGIAVLLGAGASAALVAVLHARLGLAETVGVAAVTAVLFGLYQLRRSARRALVYDRAPAPRQGRDRAGPS